MGGGYYVVEGGYYVMESGYYVIPGGSTHRLWVYVMACGSTSRNMGIRHGRWVPSRKVGRATTSWNVVCVMECGPTSWKVATASYKVGLRHGRWVYVLEGGYYVIKGLLLYVTVQ